MVYLSPFSTDPLIFYHKQTTYVYYVGGFVTYDSNNF